jgi:lipopolysaccharide export system permease protein
MSAYRIQKYILREVCVPFVLGIALFTFVLLLSRMLKLIELIIDKGVPFSEILSLFTALLPSFFVITVPLSFLLATIIAFGRLSADSEVVAMKAAGLSLYQLAKPILVLAIMVSLFTGWLTTYAEPLGRSSLRQQLLNIAFSRAAVAIVPQVFNEEIDGLMLYANEVDPKSGALKEVFISDDRMGQPAVITARKGRIYTDKSNGKLLMHLQQGTIHHLKKNQASESYQLVNFDSYDINLSVNDSAQNTSTKPPKSFELSTPKLMDYIKSAAPENQVKYIVELQERFILPLSPIIFAFLAIPLGIRSHRSSRGGGFASALFVFLIYYLLFSISKTMVLENGWPPLPSMWSSTILLFALSTVLLYFSAKEQPFPGSIIVQNVMTRLNNYLSRKR